MAQVRKRVRLVNPRRKRRKMSAKQIRYFGTKRQKAALKAKRKRATPKVRRVSRARPVRKATRKRRTRRANVGEIITIGLNPGGSMARTRKRRVRRTTRRRNAPKIRYRTRYVAKARRNPVKRRRRRTVSRRRVRRNPGMFSGRARQVVGVIGGAAATKMIVDRLPYGLNVGVPGYISTAVVAILQGWAVGKFGRQRALGQDMQLGGFVYLGLRLLQDFFPSVASISPLGLRGMGVIGPSNFYVPQVPRTNSMTSFVRPRSIPAMVAGNGVSGLGRRMPRMGRVA